MSHTHLFRILVTLTLTQAHPGKVVPAPGQTRQNLLEPSSPQACIYAGRQTNFSLTALSALPGIGWDNLLNEEAGQVIAWNYSKCRTSEDGRYLIPNDIFTIPIKSSHVETQSEIIDTWHKTTSTTAKSINANAGGSYDMVQASGSFSSEHKRIKSSQMRDNSASTRTQLRYHKYKTILQPGAQLHPRFKSSLLEIVKLLEKNLTQSASYDAQLLVRKYGEDGCCAKGPWLYSGTHVQTYVVTGAGLVKTDFVESGYVNTDQLTKRKIRASASLSFASTFHFGTTYKQSTGAVTDTQYKNRITDSFVQSYGGPHLSPFETRVTDWLNGIDTNLVPMDRSGDFLHYLITEQTLPELPSRIRNLLEKLVKEAIEEYYEMNIIRGCTQRNSPNFNAAANVDDKSCLLVDKKTEFGGVYQNCSALGNSIYKQACAGLNHVNPLTGKYGCPAGYRSVELVSGIHHGKPESHTETSDCGFLDLGRCSHTFHYQDIAKYTTYWCVAITANPVELGFNFGGIYSHSTTNVVTGTKSCPNGFSSHPILFEHFACLKLASGDGVDMNFGGFISCTGGNPMAVPPGKRKEPRKNFPAQCPKGFSRQLASKIDGCDIGCCVKSGPLKGPSIRSIRRPPFASRPHAIEEPHVYTITNSTYEYEQELLKPNVTTMSPTVSNFQGHEDDLRRDVNGQIKQSHATRLTLCSQSTLSLAMLTFLLK